MQVSHSAFPRTDNVREIIIDGIPYRGSETVAVNARAKTRRFSSLDCHRRFVDRRRRATPDPKLAREGLRESAMKENFPDRESSASRFGIEDFERKRHRVGEENESWRSSTFLDISA